MMAKAGRCGCGCGQPTRLGKVVDLAAEGRTRAEIAAEMGTTYGHVKQILNTPPKYLKGHSPGTTTTRYLRSRASFAERKAPRLRAYVRVVEARKRYRSGDRKKIAETKSLALAKELRAFDLRGLAAASAEPPDAAALQLVRTLRRSIRRPEPKLREPDPTIEWLRAQVGIGWKRDQPFNDPKLRSLQALDSRGNNYRSGDAQWWHDKRATDPQELFEEQLELSVAAQMVASGDPLVTRALALPESLTENERKHLSDIFSVLEHSELAGGIPELLSNRYRAQGGGINHGFGSRKTRHQKIAHAQIKRATGRSGRPSRKPRQTYRLVEAG